MSLATLSSDTLLIDGLITIDSDLNRAATEGVLHPLAETAERFRDISQDPEFFQVLRDRLYRMGYLARRGGPNHVDDSLTRAIEQLQREAHLTVDGWIGSNSWSALQELFAFEPSTAVERWIDRQGMSIAMRRAVYLRLVSLGVVVGSPRASASSLKDQHLQIWRDLLLAINAPGIDSGTDPISIQVIAFLFDIDALTSLVADLAARKSDGEQHSETLHRFLNCLLQIELWLLGYDKLKPDGKPLKLTRQRRKRAGARGKSAGYQYSQFYSVLRQFWRDRGLTLEHAESERLILQTLSHLAQLQDDEASPSNGSDINSLITQIDEDAAAVEMQWQSQSLMGRLWDGVKRVWRFLKRFVGAVIDRIKLLARAARQLAADSFSVIRRTQKIFSEAASFLWKPAVAGSTQKAALHHDKDFDFKVFLDQDVAPQESQKLFQRLNHQLLCFRAAIRLLRGIFLAAMDAVAIAAGPWGWWRLIRSLLRWHNLYDEDDRRLIEAAYNVEG